MEEQLSSEQKERYARHLSLPLIGEAGQRRLQRGKILVIGAGGLGSPALMYLAAAGVGTIGIADFDHVDLSNLQRQILHQTDDVGRLKCLSARATIEAMNPDVLVHTYAERVTEQTLSSILHDQDYDMVLDCTDDMETKFLINDICVREKKAFVHGGIAAFRGQLMTYLPSGNFACYRCLFPETPSLPAAQGATPAGPFGVLPGIIGTLQATEALKYLLGIGELLAGTLLTYDALAMRFHKVHVPHDAHCPACGSGF